MTTDELIQVATAVVDEINTAREKGETDLRQVLVWLIDRLYEEFGTKESIHE